LLIRPWGIALADQAMYSAAVKMAWSAMRLLAEMA
jgi:hypothetical protein